MGRTSRGSRSRRMSWTCVTPPSSARLPLAAPSATSCRAILETPILTVRPFGEQMVLHEEGEHKFYQKVRKATGPMWVPGSGDSEDPRVFPQPPAFMMHHSPNTLNTQPKALWTRLSPTDGDANGIGAALRQPDAKDPPTSIPVNKSGVPRMSPPSSAPMAGSLDSMGEDVQFQVVMMQDSDDEAEEEDGDGEDGDHEVYVLDEEDGLTMEMTEAPDGEVELEVWVTESVTVEEYEDFVRGAGEDGEDGGVVEFEDEEVEGAIRDLEVYGDAQDPAHPANQPLVGSADSGNLTSFEPAGPKAEVTSAEVTAAAAAAAVEAR